MDTSAIGREGRIARAATPAGTLHFGSIRRFEAAVLLAAGLLASRTAHAVPEIEVERFGEDQIVVSWEQTERAVALETTLELLVWLSVPTPPALLDGRVRVVTARLPDERFFRLRSNAALYVVNQQDDFVGFAEFDTSEGNVAPSSRLSRGAATSLTQPRAAVVTKTGRLLVSRGNGGIVGWNKATEATGNAPAELEVAGANSFLTEPIALAYDREADRLFVGTTQAQMGVLIFEGVSGAGFDGDLAPDRTFGPDDRVPHATTGSISMTIDALKLTDDGLLYVVDTSGLAQNSSRILVYGSTRVINGMANPNRTLTGPWSKIRGIEVVDDRLYAVDDSNTLFIVDDIKTANGTVTPDQVTVEGTAVALRSVTAFDNQLYFLDENNAAILALGEIPDGGEPSVAPDRIIEGAATRLRLPSNMYISRGFREP